MLFNSFEFFIFFPVVTILFFLLPHKFRWAHLLLASCIFYMFFIPVYILILGFTIVIDYLVGIYLEKIQTQKERKKILIVSLIANIGVLAIFKYYNFFIENLTAVTSFFHISNPEPYLNIILPIGLSFHTFQAMSYTIEVYRGNQNAERHFGIYALYVMFYPQLVAGPIERPQNLIYQFYEKKTFDYERAMSGLRLIFWGLFKKIVIADRLSVYVNSVYNNVDAYHGYPLIWATLFFSIQIYCDFSGYSDIAIGSARFMGFDLMRNFNLPYLSKSIKEFWSRWHISLSTWFRDYLYIPLGGNRVIKWRWYYNLFITFFISGLWHGANWTFLIWGALHGIYLVFALIANEVNLNILKKQHFLTTFLNQLFTFFLVYFAWIFFRANNLTEAFFVIENMLNFKNSGFIGVPIFTLYSFSLCIMAVILFVISDLIIKVDFYNKAKKYSMRQNISFFSIIIIVIYLFGVFEKQAFIYFQF